MSGSHIDQKGVPKSKELDKYLMDTLLDPMTLSPMEEPVIAGDNETYNRQSILEFFATQKKALIEQNRMLKLKQQPPLPLQFTSPGNLHVVFTDEKLRPNDTVKKMLADFRDTVAPKLAELERLKQSSEQKENEALKKQLAEKDRQLAERDRALLQAQQKHDHFVVELAELKASDAKKDRQIEDVHQKLKFIALQYERDTQQLAVLTQKLKALQQENDRLQREIGRLLSERYNNERREVAFDAELQALLRRYNKSAGQRMHSQPVDRKHEQAAPAEQKSQAGPSLSSNAKTLQLFQVDVARLLGPDSDDDEFVQSPGPQSGYAFLDEPLSPTPSGLKYTASQYFHRPLHLGTVTPVAGASATQAAVYKKPNC